MARTKIQNVEMKPDSEISIDDTVELTAAAEKIAVLEKENEALKAQIKSLETQLPKRMEKVEFSKDAVLRAQVCI